MTSCSRAGSFPTTSRKRISLNPTTTSSSTSVGCVATTSPSEVSLSSPSGLSRLALDDVDRNPDGARLVRNAALHRLANPPRRIRRELVPAPPVELLHRADQP